MRIDIFSGVLIKFSYEYLCVHNANYYLHYNKQINRIMHFGEMQSVKIGENDMWAVELYIQICRFFLYSKATFIHDTG